MAPRTALLAAVALLGFVAPRAHGAAGCPAGRDSILILGVFHMASSEDAVKSTPGNMLSPRRQAEIEDLVGRLARFRPTQVAIESGRTSTTWNDRYSRWLKGDYTLGSNEIEQIGFRLARKAGLERLTPVDYPMWMNGLTPAERHTPRPQPTYAHPPPQAESPQMAGIRAAVASDDSVLARSTVTQYLTYLNTPEQAALHHRWDVLDNLSPGDGDALYEKTDLATNWYKRNLRIFTNLLEVHRPGDRIVLIIGVGHLHILEDLAATHPRFCLVDVRSYLK